MSELNVGDKVHYRNTFDKNYFENGIVKTIPEIFDNYVWVVYHCDNKWDEYHKYTGVRTCIDDLNIGWK